MKILCYIVFLAIALLLAFDDEWFVFWLFVVVALFLIVYGNHLENSRIN
jgi:hypothetical protein